VAGDDEDGPIVGAASPGSVAPGVPVEPATCPPRPGPDGAGTSELKKRAHSIAMTSPNTMPTVVWRENVSSDRTGHLPRGLAERAPRHRSFDWYVVSFDPDQ
jgi:hypothetical protein